jgi:predicted small integral membrane protein
MANFAPIIVFGALVVVAFWLGGMGMDTAAENRKKQQ